MSDKWIAKEGISDEGADAYVWAGDVDVACCYGYPRENALRIAHEIANDHNTVQALQALNRRLVEAGRAVISAVNADNGDDSRASDIWEALDTLQAVIAEHEGGGAGGGK